MKFICYVIVERRMILFGGGKRNESHFVNLQDKPENELFFIGF